MNLGWVKGLLAVSGIYDGVLGLVFLLFPAAVYRMTEIAPPNHFAYVQFPALLLLLFAVMFFRAAADPVQRREVILYGMGLKLSYFGIVFWYQMQGGLPRLWVPFAYADVAFFALFWLAWRVVGKARQQAA